MCGALSAITNCNSDAANSGSLLPGRGGLSLLAALFGGANQRFELVAGVSKARAAGYSDKRNIRGGPFITYRGLGR